MMKFSTILFAVGALPLVSAQALGPDSEIVEQCCAPNTERRELRVMLGGDEEICFNTMAANNESGEYTCTDMATLCADNGYFLCSRIPGFCCQTCIIGRNCVNNQMPVADIAAECLNQEYATYCGVQPCVKDDGTACGDPHFQTWSGDWFDFHGECDLAFLSYPEFDSGLGMNIHLRTKARYEYSFIESAALQIGDDILEVGSFGEYFYNGVFQADMTGVKMGHDQYPIEIYDVTEKATHFQITLGSDQHILIKVFKDLVSVSVHQAMFKNFGGSFGMMGDFFEGKMLARDGETVITDADEFGLEWQVRAEEPKLFNSDREPQFPTQCVMPGKNASVERRRLAGVGFSTEEAEAVCGHVTNEKMLDNCVYDVMATGDLETAQSY